MIADDIFVLRPALDSDMAFVYDSWVKEYAASPFARSEGSDYCDIQDLVAKALVQRSALLICALADDPSYIVGWACTGPDVVHYVVVKRKWRQRGIASKLLAPYLSRTRVEYSHRPMPGVAKKVPDTWLYRSIHRYGFIPVAA